MQLKLLLIFLVPIVTGVLSYDYLVENSPREILWDAQGLFSKRPLEIILSFDYEDDEGSKNLPAIFDVLQKHNASATFFVVGRIAEANPESVREIARRNYSIGLHTYAHGYPVFNANHVEELARVYNTSKIDWSNRIETKEALIADLRKSRYAVESALGEPLRLLMFRSPALTPNWASSKEYFEALAEARVAIDSSVYQDFKNPEPYFAVNGILEVPVVSSDSALKSFRGLKADKASKKRVPYILVLHPQKLDAQQLDALLAFLEGNYQVTYLKIEEVPAFYGEQS